MKRLFALLILVAVLLCTGGCKSEDAPDADTSTGNTHQTEIADPSQGDNATSTEVATNAATIYVPAETESSATENTNSKSSVFNTEGIVGVSLRTDYGQGEEHIVPEEHMEDIINWLGSFTVDSIIDKDEIIPPGCNFYSVKIEYSDGTVVDNGLSTVDIDGQSYYMNSPRVPECFWDILS